MQAEYYLTSAQYDFFNTILKKDLELINLELKKEDRQHSIAALIEKRYILNSLLIYFEELDNYQYDFENDMYIMYMPLFVKDMLIYYLINKI